MSHIFKGTDPGEDWNPEALTQSPESDAGPSSPVLDSTSLTPEEAEYGQRAYEVFKAAAPSWLEISHGWGELSLGMRRAWAAAASAVRRGRSVTDAVLASLEAEALASLPSGAKVTVRRDKGAKDTVVVIAWDFSQMPDADESLASQQLGQFFVRATKDLDSSVRFKLVSAEVGERVEQQVYAYSNPTAQVLS